MGAGYVGLVTGVGLATLGHKVKIYDIDENKICQLRQGKCPFHEPGIEEHLDEPSISYHTDFKETLHDTEFTFICVGTPTGSYGMPNMEYVFNAAHQINLTLSHPNHTVIVKSTVLPGTTRIIQGIIPHAKVVSTPEFLREGSALSDFLHSDGIVIGSDDEEAGKRVAELFKGIKCPIIHTTPNNSEMIKYGSNCMIAVRLSYINELALMCEKCGCDIDVVTHGMSLSQHIGNKCMSAGPGWGGSCLPKDGKGMLALSKFHDVNMYTLFGALETNEEMISHIIQKLSKWKKIAILGLSFKENTSDLRESKSTQLINELIRSHPTINFQTYDPIVNEGCNTMEEAIRGCDAVVLMLGYKSFDKGPDFYSHYMNGNLIIDTRRVIKDRTRYINAGFNIYALGVRE
jgi:UDPglucose 6-dehydrogenase